MHKNIPVYEILLFISETCFLRSQSEFVQILEGNGHLESYLLGLQLMPLTKECFKAQLLTEQVTSKKSLYVLSEVVPFLHTATSCN